MQIKQVDCDMAWRFFGILFLFYIRLVDSQKIKQKGKTRKIMLGTKFQNYTKTYLKVGFEYKQIYTAAKLNSKTVKLKPKPLNLNHQIKICPIHNKR